MNISAANITFNEQGTPSSSDFDDVYFSNENGMAETHYVFIEGNDLFKRWQNHNTASFCIGETGFGTGLNFFCTAALFLSFREQHPTHVLQHLHFISTEKHPIEECQAAQVLLAWPQFSALTQQWLSNYPSIIEGVHRRHFGQHISLDVHYNDATQAFDALQSVSPNIVDAWFLDGFAPSKNNSMWSQALFNTMAQLSNTNATLATFTAAGFVKRGLMAAGFNMHKRKGFMHKREMLIGTFDGSHELPETELPEHINFTANLPYYARFASTYTQKQTAIPKICIVGSGLAGAISALKCVQAGIPVRLLWQGNTPADGASGSPIGGFYPQLNAQHNHASRLQLASFLYARSFYDDVAKIVPFDHDWCGALQLGFNENTNTRLQKLANAAYWPEDIAHIKDSEAASKIANVSIPYNCLHMPKAGWISPQSLIHACITLAQSSGLLELEPNTQLQSYELINDQHINLNTVVDGQTKVIEASSLIIACGDGSKELLSPSIPLRLTRGQVEMVSSQGTLMQLNTLLCHKGYLTPALNSFHALGSTYVKNDTGREIRHIETEQNFSMHLQSMQAAQWVEELGDFQNNSSNFARAAIRCSSPDHLPVVGAMPSEMQFTELADLYKALPAHRYPVPTVHNNVYVLTGLGSRGLTTAPLMAEVLVSEILGRAIPLPTDLLNAISPNRFIVRSLIRRQAMPS